MRATTGECRLGDSACTVNSVIFGVHAIVDADQASAAAWKSVFDSFLRTYAVVREEEFVPFDVRTDYMRYLRGRPRIAGARAFLASRDLTLPYDDLRGLAMSQEEFFIGEVRRYGLVPFPSTLAVVRELRRHGVCTAALSVQLHGVELLRKAGVAAMFDVVVDGLDAPGTQLPEHPGAQMYLQAARRLNTPPARTAVVESSPLGVTAARECGFGAVVGVDRTGGSAALGERGASPVIADLDELPVHTRNVA